MLRTHRITWMPFSAEGSQCANGKEQRSLLLPRQDNLIYFERTIPEARWGHAVPIKRKRAWKPKVN
jgi:hypothetical protein